MLLPGRGLLSHDHPGSVSTWDTPGSVSRSFLTGMTWARRRNKNTQHSVVFLQANDVAMKATRQVNLGVHPFVRLRRLLTLCSPHECRLASVVQLSAALKMAGGIFCCYGTRTHRVALKCGIVHSGADLCKGPTGNTHTPVLVTDW